TVDRVDAVGVHVVRQAGCAADPGDEDELVGLHPEVGEQKLQRGGDAVVAAARAPAHLLVGHEVLAGELDRGDAPGAVGGAVGRRGHRSSSAIIRSSISWAPKGNPDTLVKLLTSAR